MSALTPIYAPWDGNATAMAADIEEADITVRQWRYRGNIPVRYWAKIINAAEKRGHTLTNDMFVEAIAPEEPDHSGSAPSAEAKAA